MSKHLLPLLASALGTVACAGAVVEPVDASGPGDVGLRDAAPPADAAPDAGEPADTGAPADAAPPDAAPADAGPANAVIAICDAPVVIDDRSPFGGDRYAITFHQAPGAPTLLSWISGDRVLGRFLDGETLTATVTLATRPAQIDVIEDGYAAVGPSGAAFVATNGDRGVLRYYDRAIGAWTSPETRQGLHRSALAIAPDGSVLHTTADFVASRIGLLVRAPNGTFGAEVPVLALAPERANARRLVLDGDRGALVVLTNTRLLGVALAGTATVGEVAELGASPGATISSEPLIHRGPGGSVVVIWMENAVGGSSVRAATLSREGGVTSWSTAETIHGESVRLLGIFVDDRGDVTYTFAQGGHWFAHRREGGAWGAPADLGVGGLWFTNVVGRPATGEVFVANTDSDQGTKLDLYGIARGETQWTGPVSVDAAAKPTWTLPQRPRLGLGDDGVVRVAWSAHRDAGPNEIVMAKCR